MSFPRHIYVIAVPLLEISIYGCRIWPLAGKIGQKILNVVSGLKIDGCSCTRCTRTKKVPCCTFKKGYGIINVGHVGTHLLLRICITQCFLKSLRNLLLPASADFSQRRKIITKKELNQITCWNYLNYFLSSFDVNLPML